mmetsp:Transcript_9503/g.12457  ORF Transcript_9503/g.12457 Transcript_9503/m.12457 type:complete len:92 (+) Transcript_9503:788-1063(+)
MPQATRTTVAMHLHSLTSYASFQSSRLISSLGNLIFHHPPKAYVTKCSDSSDMSSAVGNQLWHLMTECKHITMEALMRYSSLIATVTYLTR